MYKYYNNTMLTYDTDLGLDNPMFDADSSIKKCIRQISFDFKS